MPWPIKDIAAINEQWKWFPKCRSCWAVTSRRGTLRTLGTAVLQGQHVREAIEIAVKDINRELRKKQEEFGIYVERPVRRSRSKSCS